MTDELIGQRVAALAGRGVVSMEVCTGGYTQAVRRRVVFDDGGTAFAKCATDARTAEWLHAEIDLYGSLEASFLPAVMAADTTDPPLVVLEDLSGAVWPPPWTADRVDRVLAALEDMHGRSIEVPGYGKVVGDSGWHEVADDPAQLLGLGVVSESWLRRCLPALLAAQDSVETEGTSLCHRAPVMALWLQATSPAGPGAPKCRTVPACGFCSDANSRRASTGFSRSSSCHLSTECASLQNDRAC